MTALNRMEFPLPAVEYQTSPPFACSWRRIITSQNARTVAINRENHYLEECIRTANFAFQSAFSNIGSVADDSLTVNPIKDSDTAAAAP